MGLCKSKPSDRHDDGMANTTSVTVSEGRSQVSYDRSGSDVKDSKKKDFTFSIRDAGDGHDGGMANTTSVTVSEGKSQVSYDRSGSDVKDSKKKDFTFSIRDAGGGKEKAVLQMSSGGKVRRQHESKPFPTGAFRKKGDDLNKVNYNVQLKKTGDHKLATYFD